MMMKCPRCDGWGYFIIEDIVFDPSQEQYYPGWNEFPCNICGGTGEIPEIFITFWDFNTMPDSDTETKSEE